MSENFKVMGSKILGASGIVVSTTGLAVPDPVISKVLLALGTGLTGASLYFLGTEIKKIEKKVVPVEV